MDAWNRIEDWLATNAPEVAKTLNAGATKAAIADLERKLGIKLTKQEKECFSCHDGQDTFGPPIVGPWLLLPIEEIPRQHQITLDATSAADADATVQPEKGVRQCWYHAKWVPWAFDRAGSFLCLDHAPAPGGKQGQIIHVSSRDTARPVVAAGVTDWLDRLAHDLQAGKYVWRDRRVQPSNSPA